MKTIHLGLFFIALCVCGCQQIGKNPTLIPIYTQPLVQREQDTSAPFTSYHTFFVMPYYEPDEKISHEMTPITYGQLSFILRNAFECLGYKYARSEQEADLICFLYYSNTYKSQYVPPSIAIVPFYVPGTTQTTNVTVYGRGGSAWGTATTTTTPGHFVPMPVTRPGYYTGAYYPYIRVVICDRVSEKQIWTGYCMTATPEQDMRRSGQVLVSYLLVSETQSYFPVCSEAPDDSSNGTFGLGLGIATTDGNNFYPFIMILAVGSPAADSGLKLYDKITAIDGHSTQNLHMDHIINMMDKPLGGQVTLTIERNGVSSNVILLAWTEDLARSQWREIIAPILDGTFKRKQVDETWWKDFKYLWGVF